MHPTLLEGGGGEVTASDATSGVASVHYSVEQVSTGKFWTGSGASFTSTPEVLVAASGTTGWSAAFPIGNFPANGTYTVRSYATDTAGNVQATAGSSTFTIDRAAPAVTSITRLNPSPTNASSVQYTVTFNKPVSGVTTGIFGLTTTGTLGSTSVTTATGSAPTATWTVTVNTGTGDGTLRLDQTSAGSVVDGSGNALSGTFTTGDVYTIDRTNPNAPSILTNPANPTNSTTATFTFSATDPTVGGVSSGVASFECNLDAGSFAPCISGETYTGLGGGSHTFHVRAIDNATNTGSDSTFTWVVDTTAPAVTLISPANGSTVNTKTPSFSGAAGTAVGDSSTITVRIYAGTNTSGTLLQTLTTTAVSGAYSVASAVLANGTYTAQAEQDDNVGNPGFSSPNTFTVDFSPALKIEKTGSYTTGTGNTVGDVITYSYTVTNIGNVTLHGATATDGSLGPITLSATTLAPTGVATGTLTYALVQADLDAGSVANTADAAALDTNDATVNAAQATFSIPTTQSPSLHLDKTATEATYSAVGDPIHYSYLLTNTGNVTLAGPFTVTDDHVAVTCPSDASLAPGFSITCSATYAIVASDLSDGVVTNSATAHAAFDADPVDSNTDHVTVHAVVVVVGKAFLDTSVDAGTNDHSFTITVSNDGTADAHNVHVTDTIDPLLVVTGVTDDQVPFLHCGGGNALSCTFGTLAAGDSVVITVTYDVNSTAPAGTVLNTAAATATEVPIPATGSTSIDITTSADLEVAKDDGVTSVVAGAATVHTYTITATNHGPSDALSVVLTDTWPTGFTQGTITGTGCTLDGGTGPNFTCALGTIAAGTFKTVTVTYTVPSSTTAAQTNTASVSSATTDPGVFVNTASDTDTITTSADLEVTKTGPTDPVKVGDEFSYTITVTNHGPSDNAGFTVVDVLPTEVTVVSVSADCVQGPVGTVTCTGAGLAANASISYTITVSADAVGTPVNVATITSTTDMSPTNDTGSQQTSIVPATLLSDVAAGDPEWQNKIDGVDVLFTKTGSGTTTNYTLKATNPGTFKYRLSLTNETGIDIHVKGKQLPNIIKNGVSIPDVNGGSSTVFLTVPNMPTNTGTPNPLSTAQLAQPAFVLTGHDPVKAHPDDRSDDLSIIVKYIPFDPLAPTTSPGDCSSTANSSLYVPLPSNADGKIAWCIKVDGLEIPKHHAAHIDVAYEFRWKNTANWGSASIDPTLLFRAGFNFRDTTVIVLDTFPAELETKLDQQLQKLPAAVRAEYKAKFMSLWNNTYTGSNALGLVFAGEKMTAVGGFVFDPSANGRPNITVRLFSAPPRVDRCGTTYTYGANNLVASYTTGSDGFYFIWQKNIDNTALVSGTNTLASGYKYYVALCDFTGAPGSGTAMPFAQLYWPARSMNSTLGNKEFDEEDFYVSGPTRLTYQSQPISGKVNRTLGTTKVALLDGFGNVMTMDSGGGASTIVLSLVPGGPGGTLSSSSSLTKQLTLGVATWSDLKITLPTGVYKLNAASSVSGVPDEKSLPINMTN